MSTPNSGLSIAQQMIQDGTMPDMPASPVPMRAVVSAVSTMNPDAEAKTQQLAQQAGMPVDLTRSNPEAARQRAVSAELDRRELEIRNPILASQLRDPEFAGVAHDDLDSLSRIENGAAQMRAYDPTWADRNYAAGEWVKRNVGHAVMEFPPTRFAADTVAGAAGMLGNIGSFVGIHGDGSTQQNMLQRLDAGTTGENFGLAPGGNDAEMKVAGPLLATLPISAGVGFVSKALGLSENAAKVLTALGVGSAFSADQGGSTFTQLAGAGKSDADARSAADKVFGLTLPANVAMGLSDFVPFLKRNPLLSSFGMGGATGTTGQLAQNVVTGQPWSKDLGSGALQGAAVMGGMHLGAAGLGFHDEPPAAMEGPKTFQQTMSEMVDAVEASKLRKRSPEKFQQNLDGQFAGQGSFLVPSQDFVNYFQGKSIDPAAMANNLGATNLAEAAAAGSDLEIPKANFFGKLDPEHQKALLPDVVNPSTEMSARQTVAATTELQEWAAKGLQRLQEEYAQADAETQATPEWKKVHDDLKQRYVDAGEAEPVADSYATLQANAISNLARKAGLKPEELLALHNPDIKVGEAPAALYQSGVPIGGMEGKTSTLLTPGGGRPAQYKLVEAADLVPSHDPVTFKKNPDYPEGVQERAYDTSKEAQARVISQARKYEPAYTVNTNPDAVNGPPVITPDGTVLGGNSRAMSTVRLYRDGDPSAYRDALKRGAANYGLKPEDIDAMKEPILVRQIEAPPNTEALRRLGSDLNKSATGALGVSERAVSAGKAIKPETLRWAADAMDADDSSLREFLGRHGNEVVRRLTQDGVITERERPQFIDAATGGLSEEGKTFTERALLGSVLDDPRLMDAAPKSTLQKLERSLGSITSFAGRDDQWNLLPAIRAAVGELGSIQREGSSVELRLGQTSLFGEERNPLVDALVRSLDGKPNAVREAFEKYARDADENKPGQARMFEPGEAFDAFNHAFGAKLTDKEFQDGIDRAQGKNPAADADVSGVPAGSAGAGGEEPGGEAGRAGGDGADAAGRESERAAGGNEPADGGAAERADAVHAVAGDKRGWFRMWPDGSYEIGKTKVGDFSTFVHEPAHAYLEMFRELTQREAASDTLKDDFRKITAWLGTTPEEAYRDGFTREQHEKWATANEQYLRDGNAPSSALRRVFDHFSVWLKSVYGRATRLGVEMSPEIRGVMDRLYQSEDAVNRASLESGRPLFEKAEDAGWSEQEQQNYADTKGLAIEKARVQLQRELSEAALRERTDKWREEKNNVRDAVTQEVDKQPEYKAIRSLRRGSLEDGTPMTLNKDELIKQFGEDRVKALQRQHPMLYRAEGGTDAETAAELFGYGSGEEMMRALENAPRRAIAIERGTRDYMTAKHGDIRYDGSLDDKARLAVENDERAKGLHKELSVLQVKVDSLQKKAADTKEAMAAIATEPLEHYQEAARQMIDQKAIADLQPGRYLNASRRFSREAFDALRKGDAKAALDAKNKELLNHFLFREASAARDYADKFESYAKRMQSKGIQQRLGLAQQSSGIDYRDQFNWLLARYRLGPQAAMPERSLRAWADEVYGNGNEPAIDPGILDSNKFADYRNVPLSEVHDLHDALINVRHLAQQEFKMFVQGKQVEFASAKQAMIEAARENLRVKPEKVFDENQTLGDRIAAKAGAADAMLIRMERLVEWLDGGKAGPWHDNLWNLASDSQGDEYALQEQVTKPILEGIQDIPDSMRGELWERKVVIDGIGEPITRRRMLSIAFNMGNEGNLDRLRKTFISFGWDPDAIRTVASQLTRDEWQFVQRTWDSLKPIGDRMRDLEKRLTGLEPAMVKAVPFKVKPIGGDSEIELAGGYYPIKMDQRFSQRAIEQDAKESAQNAMQSGYVRATTSKGYTKERSGFGGPLDLNFESVLSDHLAKSTKDISHREFMLASQRFLLDTEVRKTLRETLGPAYEKQFMPWLRTIINDRNGSTGQGVEALSNAMQTLRANVVTASLGFKVSTSLLQITHAPRMMLYAKPGSIAQSLVDFLAHPVEMTAGNRELSRNEMRFRGDNLDRDIRGVLQDPAYREGYEHKVATAARWTLSTIDHLFSHTLWRAAYRDGLEKYAELPESEASSKAIYEADSAVRLGLGTAAPKDLPAIMRNNDFNKMITTLYGFHNGVYNQMRDIGHQFRYDRNVGKLTFAGILTAVVPALLGALVTGDGPKDGENPGLWAAKRSLLFSADTVPMLNSVVQFMARGRDMQFTPIEGVLENGAKAAMEISSGKDDKDWLGIGLDAGSVAGSLAGIPGSQQAVKTLRYIHRVNQGKVEDPNWWNAIAGGR